MNFIFIGCLEVEMLVLDLTLFNLFLDISSSWVETSLHAEFQLPSLPGSGSSMVGDKKNNNKKLGRIRGFLSPS